MDRETITIKDVQTGMVLAEAILGEGVQLFEGAWYFDRHAVDMTHLVISERTYTCHYKGVCYWIDLDASHHKARDVGFIYFDLKEGYEFLKNKIAFYAGQRQATVEKATVIK